MHVPSNIGEYTIGRVVRFLNKANSLDGVWVYGHIEGLALNCKNEVVIVVKFPRPVVDNMRLEPQTYTFEAIHPANLELL